MLIIAFRNQKINQELKQKEDAINTLLLQYLVHRSDKERCFPAVETIAKALNVCKRTVQYNMRKLEKAGYIIRKDRWYNHQQLTNQYVFNLGITEDVPGQIRYTDDEKEQIRQLSFHIPDDDNHRIRKKSNYCLIYINSRLYRLLALDNQRLDHCK